MDWVSFPWDKAFVVLTVIISGAGIVIGVIVPAIGQALVASKAMNAMARQPEASDSINRALLIALAMLESLAIYILAVILILLFANPLRAYIIRLIEVPSEWRVFPVGAGVIPPPMARDRPSSPVRPGYRIRQ